MDLQLAGKVAIVTGSSKGLGLAASRALVEEGCRVTICPAARRPSARPPRISARSPAAPTASLR